MAFECCGSELSYRKIAAANGISIDTVKSYLEACEQAYLIFHCQYFSFSERKRANFNKKYYPIDPGLRNAISSNTTEDLGKSFESLIFLRLKKQNEQIYYWKDGSKFEVDFITVNNKSITPYQVTWENPQERHYIALDKFYQAFPFANEAIIINKENAAEYL